MRFTLGVPPPELTDGDVHVVRERFGNGVVQDYERDHRDSVGLPSAIAVGSASGAALYHIEVNRTAWGDISAIRDLDGAT
jgi:hypothetical protein